MADTFTSLHYHIVFSTKNREPWIDASIEERIWTYLAGMATHHGLMALKVGGLEDHLHLVLRIPPTIPVSEAVRLLKGSSSRWIRQTFSELEAFRWQDGYGAFTVSTSALPATIRYVEQQRATHERRTFEDEFLFLLQRHGIEYDERYLWR
jgi:REP element-mobilizing transposase RayT